MSADFDYDGKSMCNNTAPGVAGQQTSELQSHVAVESIGKHPAFRDMLTSMALSASEVKQCHEATKKLTIIIDSIVAEKVAAAEQKGYARGLAHQVGLVDAIDVLMGKGDAYPMPWQQKCEIAKAAVDACMPIAHPFAS